MEGKYTKYFKFQTIITEDVLKRIDKYLRSITNNIKYNFETSDGAEYSTTDMNEIIDYDNPNKARIEKITFQALRDDKLYRNFIIVKLYDKGKWDSSASLYISEASSDEITFIRTTIARFIEEAKAPHWWLYSRWFTMSLIGLVAILGTYLLYTFVVPQIKENNPSWWIQTTLLLFFSTLIFCAIFYAIIYRVFPESIFLIGEQKNRLAKIHKRRNMILTTISTIILGIIASIIATELC